MYNNIQKIIYNIATNENISQEVKIEAISYIQSMDWLKDADGRTNSEFLHLIFVWDETPQGHDFWSSISRKLYNNYHE